MCVFSIIYGRAVTDDRDVIVDTWESHYGGQTIRIFHFAAIVTNSDDSTRRRSDRRRLSRARARASFRLRTIYVSYYYYYVVRIRFP